MRQLITSYTFVPGSKSVTFTPPQGGSIVLENLFAIVDVTLNNIIYQSNNPLLGGTVSGTTVTLTFDTTTGGYSGTDRLQIFYENQAAPVTAKMQDGAGSAITSTLTGGKQRLDVTLSSSGALGTTTPTNANLVAGSDGTNMQALKVSAAGVLSVDTSSSASQPLPTGASTAANQATSNASLASIVTNTNNPSVKLQDGLGNLVTSTVAGSKRPIDVQLFGSSGVANNSRPDAQVRVAMDTTTLFYDSFDSGIVDVTNRWTSTGTAATASNGTLSVSAGTTALAFSSLQSQPTFPLLGSMFINPISIMQVDSGLKTGAYRFFGLGTAPGSPTVASPVVNGVGFEWSSADGVLRGVVWSGGAQTQTVSLSTSQPTDGLLHRYALYYKTSRLYFEIDNVQVGTLAIPSPNTSNLPLLNLVVNGASAVSPAAVYQASFVGAGDTARNNVMISDASFPWRKAQVSASGAVLMTSAGIPASLGQQGAATSQPVALANENVQDLSVTGQSAQTAVVSNILTAPSGAAATDLTGYRSASVQVVSTGTAGTFIFEGSNDNVNFQTLPVFNQLILTGTPIVAAITATASQLVYSFPVTTRFARLRIASTITGGSIQSFLVAKQVSFAPAVIQVAQSTAASLNANVGTVTTVTGVTTVASVTSANLGIPSIVTDVTSAALTTTTTTAAFTPGFGPCYSVVIPVTAVSGTTPTLDLTIQESDDSGTNWVAVFDFPRITAVGFYRSAVIPFTGNRIRYVQTVTGTTPSFTRAVNRVQSSLATNTPLRQQVDRTIVLTTLNSTTPSLTSCRCTLQQLVINVGAITTTPPALQLEGSDDAGASWYAIGTPLTAVASSTVQATFSSMNSQLNRARVSTAGVGVTAGYVLIKSF